MSEPTLLPVEQCDRDAATIHEALALADTWIVTECSHLSGCDWYDDELCSCGFDDLKHRLDTALASKWLDPTSPGREAIERDAARWRALLGCARIRLLGSANVGDDGEVQDRANWVHFGAEFWSVYPRYEAKDYDRRPRAEKAIIALADHVRALSANDTQPPVERGGS